MATDSKRAHEDLTSVKTPHPNQSYLFESHIAACYNALLNCINTLTAQRLKKLVNRCKCYKHVLSSLYSKHV